MSEHLARWQRCAVSQACSRVSMHRRIRPGTDLHGELRHFVPTHMPAGAPATRARKRAPGQRARKRPRDTV